MQQQWNQVIYNGILFSVLYIHIPEHNTENEKCIRKNQKQLN